LGAALIGWKREGFRESREGLRAADATPISTGELEACAQPNASAGSGVAVGGKSGLTIGF